MAEAADGIQLPPLSRAELDILWQGHLAWQQTRMDGPPLQPETRDAARRVEVILTEIRTRHHTETTGET